VTRPEKEAKMLRKPPTKRKARAKKTTQAAEAISPDKE
jgi:hypothetical protein